MVYSLVVVFLSLLTVRIAPAQPLLVDLTDILTPHFIAAYGEKKAQAIIYEELLFSPSGRYLAFSLSQITSGEAEHVWIIELETKRIRLAVKDSRFRDMEWKGDDTLLVAIAGSNFVVATIESSFTSVATDFTGFGKRTSGASSIYEMMELEKGLIQLTDLRSGKTQTASMRGHFDPQGPILWTKDGKQFLYAYNEGHGDIRLMAGVTAPTFEIIQLTSGSWNLFGFACAPIGALVAYSSDVRAIAIYDFGKREIVREISTEAWPDHFAWSVKNQLAFSAIQYRESSRGKDVLRRLYLIQL